MVAERRPSDWPAFVFVTCEKGSGWVPARHLSTDSGEAVVQRAYDTTELAVSEGERVEVIERDNESGWVWCRSSTGRSGWVPSRILEPADA